MKRQCTDPDTYTNTATTAAAVDVSAAATFIDNHQFFNPDYISYPQQQLNFAETNVPDPKPNNHSDGGSIETPRRRRGRPLGSKNKPKSPNPNPTRLEPQPDPNNQVNLPNHNNYGHQILEIPNGADVIKSIAKHAVLHNTTLRALHTSGSVADVVIRQPINHLQPIMTFFGRHDVVSLSAVFNIPTSLGLTQNAISAFNDVALAIKLSFGKGEIVGGIVVGPLIACGSVFVLVEPISNLTYQRLEDVSESTVNTTSYSDMVLNGEMYISASFMPY